MKKMFFAVLMVAASVVNAAEVTVLEAALPHARSFRTDVDTRFFVDTDSREGFVKVLVTEERTVYRPHGGNCRMGNCFPDSFPTTVTRTLLRETVKVDGLMLMDDKVVFHAPEGEVECGTLGVSRVFKRPTIYLSGKCELDEKVVETREGSKLVVTLKTK